MNGGKVISTKLHRLLFLSFAITVLLAPNSYSSKNPGQVLALNQIESDYEAGLLTYNQKALLQVQAIKAPDKTPSNYMQASTEYIGNYREATLVLKEIRMNWDQLSTETQQSISGILTRHTTAFSYVTPGGFFKIHYDITGTHAVSSADTNSNSVPDFVERIAAYCDSSWQKHLDLGFFEPPPDNGLGGDDKYDVYFENMGFYGYAVPESNGGRPWNDFYSHLVLNNDFIGFPQNDDPEGDILGAAKVTVAHEYHHSIQFGYDASEPSWFMELDATYFEDIAFDHTNDNYNYLSSFFNTPAKSLMENSIHMYASFIWGLYLAQNFDTSLMLAAWEGARYATIFATISDTLMARYGWTQDSAMADFAAWNFVTSTRNDNLHHEEAANYPLITIGATHSSYPVSLRNSADSPAGYGANYVQFLPGSSVGTLRLTFDGANTRDWAAHVILSTSINQHTFQKLSLHPSGWTDTVFVPDFEDLYAVTLVGVNITEFSAGAFFSYSAQVVIPQGVSATLITTDTSVYSGGNRLYSFNVENTTEFNHVYLIQYWDDLGWIQADTISRAINALNDTTFTLNVNPPQGTALGTVSELHFKAVSFSDTTIFQEVIHGVQTVLFRGDADFSGSISILDLTYLIDFFFRSGPSPAPVLEAGDFNCDSTTNILDLTKTVDYIFRGGSLPPCNPY